jgi:hypothetical protein
MGQEHSTALKKAFEKLDTGMKQRSSPISSKQKMGFSLAAHQISLVFSFHPSLGLFFLINSNRFHHFPSLP